MNGISKGTSGVSKRKRQEIEVSDTDSTESDHVECPNNRARPTTSLSEQDFRTRIEFIMSSDNSIS